MNDRSGLEPTAVQGSVLIAGVGASNGLGAAIARRFAAGGYPVAIAGRNAEKLAATAAELAATGAKVIHVVGDASKATDVARFVEAAGKLAPLAMAVHNAGSNRPAPFLKVTEQRFEEHWREHALGGFQLAQAAIPALLARGGGTLVFTGASGSLRGKANYAPFASAKAALRALAQSVAREFRAAGHSCRPCRGRWRHRRRSPAEHASAIEGRPRAGRAAQHRSHRGRLLGAASPASQRMDAGARPAAMG
ncbi:NAD(P)-dependent dehydrogenase (short-subunit alcohol dehydrogenase family) [Bradyrhizobium sp. JR6.1]